ncbi:hypothetical protein IscW_ISCW019014 [Ixodes scapularis]|uniref:Uncharacterized protein n=1 Tax=Ixodes scapularis TaxID=6945 RepID=B7PNC1_IXOSC|nr:hypothetical protein IscW_ISCW019014 [Ixodes scapularis]|eukprot:XP_002435284.1 hypothetical protein IscW_ISCW019014 [Ixodes scapularis]
MGDPGEAKRATRREAAVARAPRVTRHLSPPSAREGAKGPPEEGPVPRPARTKALGACARRLSPASSPANGTPSAVVHGEARSTRCPHKELGTAGRETGASLLTFITTPGAPRGGRVLAVRRPHPGEPDVRRGHLRAPPTPACRTTP